MLLYALCVHVFSHFVRVLCGSGKGQEKAYQGQERKKETKKLEITCNHAWFLIYIKN